MISRQHGRRQQQSACKSSTAIGLQDVNNNQSESRQQQSGYNSSATISRQAVNNNHSISRQQRSIYKSPKSSRSNIPAPSWFCYDHSIIYSDTTMRFNKGRGSNMSQAAREKPFSRSHLRFHPQVRRYRSIISEHNKEIPFTSVYYQATQCCPSQSRAAGNMSPANPTLEPTRIMYSKSKDRPGYKNVGSLRHESNSHHPEPVTETCNAKMTDGRRHSECCQHRLQFTRFATAHCSGTEVVDQAYLPTILLRPQSSLKPAVIMT